MVGSHRNRFLVRRPPRTWAESDHNPSRQIAKNHPPPAISSHPWLTRPFLPSYPRPTSPHLQEHPPRWPRTAPGNRGSTDVQPVFSSWKNPLHKLQKCLTNYRAAKFKRCIPAFMLPTKVNNSTAARKEIPLFNFFLRFKTGFAPHKEPYLEYYLIRGLSRLFLCRQVEPGHQVHPDTPHEIFLAGPWLPEKHESVGTHQPEL